MSILNGTEHIINCWMGLSQHGYETKSACDRLSRQFPQALCGSELMMRIYAQVEKNWCDRTYHKDPSQENWRWKKRRTRNSEKQDEVSLERRIICATDDNWTNQIPVSSGLTSRYGGRRAIDLGHRREKESYVFMELKLMKTGGHCLFAALEIIQYGILYVFARVHLLKNYQKNPLLRSDSISLRVLAPQKYYRHTKDELYNFGGLEKILSDGIGGFASTFVPGLKMDFKFTVFPEEVDWACTDKLLAALQGIKPLYEQQIT